MSRDVESLVAELQEVLDSARQNDIQKADLRRVLRFIDKVAQVVDQAFRDVILVLNQFQDLDQILADPKQLQALRSDVRDLRARDRFAQAEQICIRLKALQTTYRDEIEPLIPNKIKQKWSSLFSLLDEHEGKIIDVIHQLIWKIENDLDDSGLTPGSPVAAALRRKAREEANTIRTSLRQLDLLAAEIMALSGPDGVSVLTDTRRYEEVAKTIVQRSAWVNGSFYLVVALSITSLLLVVARTAPWYTTPLVVIGGMLFTTIIGALQLVQDQRLSEAGFGTLMELTFKQLPLIRLVARKPKE